MNTPVSPSSTPLPPNGLADSQAHAVGLTNPSLSPGRRRMLDLVNKLHNTGVQVDIDLPQIAVLGSQSAGKSSLIESISGITLPRAAGTCTRCPTECRLSRSEDPWKCIVSLHTMTNGEMKEKRFGDVIYDKALVEDRIRRAQRAILNPSKASEHYLTNEADEFEISELGFSTNFVSLQISGPDVADLSFCDLPGLIVNVGKGGDKNDITLVENLARTYIQKPSCIILLTVTCETDFQNQGAQELAKQFDPEGKRTIGVLTKPDRIPAGEETNWTALIRNEKEALDNNWYCVKQPASSELKEGITWQEARKREDEFFKLRAPWSDLDSVYQKYLRTGNLVERLSAILSDLISRRLPEIQQELENAISSCRTEINKLPREPSKDPQNDIDNLLFNFIRDLKANVDGIPDEHGLVQIIRPMHNEFRRAIRATAPNFRPFDRRTGKRKTLHEPNFLRHEEDEEILADSEGHMNTDSLSSPPIYVDEVLRRAHEARTRELPGNYPFVVQKTYIDEVTRNWHIPAERLCRRVHSVLTDYVKALVTDHFSTFGQGNLEQRVKVLLQGHINKCAERVKERIRWLLEIESLPFTLNNHYLSDYRSNFLAYYKGAREKDRNADLLSAIEEYNRPKSPVSGMFGHVSTPGRSQSSSPPQTGIAKVLAGLTEIGLTGIKPEDIMRIVPPDSMDPAFNIMADVRAYFQVAYKRFVDNVPLAIDYELVRGVERDVMPMLRSGLGINGPEGHRICRELAQENPSIAGRREDLRKKYERLANANQELLQMNI